MKKHYAMLLALVFGLTGCQNSSMEKIVIDGSILGGNYEYFRDSEYAIHFDSLSMNNTVTLNGGVVHINLHGFSNYLIVNANTEIASCTISGSGNTLENRTGTPVSCENTGLNTTILQ